MKSGVNLFKCTVLWTIVCVSSGLNTTSSIGGPNEDVSSGQNTTWNTGGQDEDTSNLGIILPVVFLTVLVFIVIVLCVYKKNSHNDGDFDDIAFPSYPTGSAFPPPNTIPCHPTTHALPLRKKVITINPTGSTALPPLKIITINPTGRALPPLKSHNDDDFGDFDDIGSSMLNTSRDITLREVNIFDDSFLGIKTRIIQRVSAQRPMFLGNRLHSDPYLASNTTVKNRRLIQDENMHGTGMKGSKSSGQKLQTRHADLSVENSLEHSDGLYVPIYPMKNKRPRGLAVIIGIDKFNDPQYDLPAVAFDRDMVKATFNAIEFEVVECVNHTKQEIEKFLSNISQKNDIVYDCFVCYISSHGLEQHVCCKDDDGKTSKGLLEIGYVISLFTNDICKTFAGKPKVFFFDICLGEHVINHESHSKEAGKGYEDEQERKAAFAHILACYATIPGYVSWTDGNGSRFTKALTYAIDKSQPNMSMDDIMYAINHIMAATKEENPQIPSYANELVKKLVLKENLNKRVRRKV